MTELYKEKPSRETKNLRSLIGRVLRKATLTATESFSPEGFSLKAQTYRTLFHRAAYIRNIGVKHLEHLSPSDLESYVWKSVGDDYKKKRDYENATLCWLRSGCGKALKNLASFYLDRQEYEKSALYFKEAGHKGAGGGYYNYAYFFYSGLIPAEDGFTALQCAKKYYKLEIKCPDPLDHLGNPIKEDKMKALACNNLGAIAYRKSQACDEPISKRKLQKKAFDYYKKTIEYDVSVTIKNQAFQALAYLYSDGFKDTSDPRCEATKLGYLQKAGDKGFYDIGLMYADGEIAPPAGKTAEEAAMDYFKRSPNYRAKIEVLSENTDDSHFKQYCIDFLTSISNLELAERLNALGLFYKNVIPEIETSIQFFYDAWKHGFGRAKDYYENARNILAYIERHKDLIAVIPTKSSEGTVGFVSDSVESVEAVPEAAAEKTDDDIGETQAEIEDIAADVARELADIEAEISAYNAQKKSDLRNYQRPVPITSFHEALEDPETSKRLLFANEGVKRAYLDKLCKETKLRAYMTELLNSSKPWGKMSMGNPEKLSRPYKGILAATSARINEVDRLVYYLKGSSIVVLDALGHYENQRERLGENFVDIAGNFVPRSIR